MADVVAWIVVAWMMFCGCVSLAVVLGVILGGFVRVVADFARGFLAETGK